MRIIPLLGAALALVRPLAAQDTAIVIHPESAGLHLTPPELPHAVVVEVVQFYNAPTTTHLVGRVRLPAGNTWTGNVAIRNGPAFIGGQVDGTVLILNGIDMVAVEGAGEFAMSGALSASMAGRTNPIEILLKVRSIAGTAAKSEIIAIREVHPGVAGTQSLAAR